MKLTAKQSRGLPVGPAASALLAEAALCDVDGWLLNRGYAYTRYVDDFRIFCRSVAEAVRARHDLTDYLYTAQRLSIQDKKSHIKTIHDFITEDLADPREEEERGRLEQLDDALWRASYATGVEVSPADLDPAIISEATRKTIRALFDDAVYRKPLHLELVRYLLRRAAVLRTAVLVEPIFDNLEVLAPALREVVLYAGRAKARLRAEHGQKLLSMLRSGIYGRLPFSRLWGLALMDNVPHLVPADDWHELALDSQLELGVRPIADWVRHHGQIGWVRERKENLWNHTPWDRRAIIRSAIALPPDERHKWLQFVAENSTDILDQAVAQMVQAELP